MRSPRDSLFKKKNSGDSDYEGNGADNDISPITDHMQNQEGKIGGEDELDEATGEERQEQEIHLTHGMTNGIDNSPLLNDSDFRKRVH
jgi:hypothetical protein